MTSVKAMCQIQSSQYCPVLKPMTGIKLLMNGNLLVSVNHQKKSWIYPYLHNFKQINTMEVSRIESQLWGLDITNKKLQTFSTKHTRNLPKRTRRESLKVILDMNFTIRLVKELVRGVALFVNNAIHIGLFLLTQIY